MKNYIWCWAYEKGCRINTADSLEKIVETFVNTHYYDSDYLAIKVDDDRINVELIYDELITQYEVEATEVAVCDFLHQLAHNMGIQEYVSIRKTKDLMEKL